MTESKKETWQMVLLFLAHEWFGKEFVEEFMSYKYKGDPFGEGEKKIDIDLDDHEKIFWNFVDALFNYLRKNRKKLPVGEFEEKSKMAAGLKGQFWAMIQLNHPEFMEPDNIGIRENYTIVSGSPQQQGNPLFELLRGAFWSWLRRRNFQRLLDFSGRRYSPTVDLDDLDLNPMLLNRHLRKFMAKHFEQSLFNNGSSLCFVGSFGIEPFYFKGDFHFLIDHLRHSFLFKEIEFLISVENGYKGKQFYYRRKD